MAAPLFQSERQLPQTGGPVLQPQALPPDPGTSAIGTALAGFGEQLGKTAEKIGNAQDETRAATARTNFIERVSPLREQYENDQDFQTARDRFQQEWVTIRDEELGAIKDQKRRAETRLHMTVTGEAAQRSVATQAYNRELDNNVAGLNIRSAEYLRSAASAASDAERAGFQSQAYADIDAQAKAGWINQDVARAKKQQFDGSLANADAMTAIRRDPNSAVALLSDPKNFAALDPVTRQGYVNQAQTAAERLSLLEVQNVAKRDPARALAIVGRTAGRDDAQIIFDRGIAPIENTTGDNTLVSNKGAVGVSQIMPGTARDVARSLRMNVLDGLDDAAVTEKLKSDPTLNVALGREYFRQMSDRYEGRIAVAAAAYNAGPGKADEWLGKAFQQYGPYFTPGQFASVIDYKETRDYVGKLYGKLGADPNSGEGLSPAGQYHAAATVHTVLRQQDAEDRASVKALAQIARDDLDPPAIFKQGYNVDPAKYASWAQRQADAAAMGDHTAAKALREAETQRELLPVRQQALRLSPAQLEAAVAEGDAALRGPAGAHKEAQQRVDLLREMLKTVRTERDQNIIGLAEEANMVRPDQRVAVNGKADPGSTDFRGALAARNAVANAAADFYEGKAIALKPQELAAVKQRWNDAGPDEQFRLLQGFGASLSGKAYSHTLAAVIGDDAQAELVGRMAQARPDIAREILSGNSLLKTKEVADKAALIRPSLASKLGGQVYPSPTMQDQVVQGALALDISRRAARGALYDPTDTSGFEKALEDITGPLVKRNGMRVPVAPGINKNSFSESLDRLSDQDVKDFGGARDRRGNEVSASIISNYAVLKPLEIGGSNYVVGMRNASARDGFDPIFTAEGKPLVVDMRALSEKKPNALGPTTYQEGHRGFRAGQAERLRADAP
jgi:soluble lytic murein transglycosylase-like protein